MRRRNPRHVIAWIAAAVLVVAGLITTVVGLLTPVSFGWFAYQPLAAQTMVPGGGGAFVSTTTLIGGAVLAAGLVALAFLLGWRFASRPRPVPSAPQLGD